MNSLRTLTGPRATFSNLNSSAPSSTDDVDNNNRRGEPPQKAVNSDMIVSFQAASQTLTYILTEQIRSGQGGQQLRPLSHAQQQLVSAKDLDADYHIVEQDALLKRLGTGTDTGLSTSEAQTRHKKDGANVLSPPRRQHWIITFILSWFVGFNWLLLIAGALDIISWEPLGIPPNPINWYLGVILFGVVAVSVGFTSYQTRKSSNILKTFKNLQPPSATTLRQGQWVSVNAVDLVVGDIVKVAMGQRIPADLRMIEVSNLKVDNSLLTGESEPVTSTTKCTSINPMESRNIVFFGSSAIEGHGTGVVVNIGDHTCMGRINELTGSSSNKKSTLQIEIDRFVFLVATAALLTGIIVTIGWAAFLRTDYPNYLPYQTLIVDITSVIIAFVPEGLPMALTMTLAVVASRMAKANVLVKNLSTIETFNTISLIASDKTGTLTQNKMSVVTVAIGTNEEQDLFRTQSRPQPPNTLLPKDGAHPAFVEVVRCGYLCNDSVQQKGGELKGDASDCAIYTFTERYVDVQAERLQNSRLNALSFNSKNKYMLSIHQLQNGARVLYVKGAPEVVMSRCTDVIDKSRSTDGQLQYRSMTPAIKAAWEQVQNNCGERGERVLGFAMRYLDPTHFPEHYEYNVTAYNAGTDKPNFPIDDLVWLGTMSLVDPPRPEVPAALEQCHTAQIRVAMVTGDNPVTACAIARQIGLIRSENVTLLSLKTDASNRVRLAATLNKNFELGSHLVGSKQKGSKQQTRRPSQVGSFGTSLPTIDFKAIGSAIKQTFKSKKHDELETELNEPRIRVFDQGNVSDRRPASNNSDPDRVSEADENEQEQQNDKSLEAASTDVFNAMTNMKSITPSSETQAVESPANATAINIKSEQSDEWLYVADHSKRIDQALVVTGAQLAMFDEVMWGWALRHNELVFARTSPEQKLQIVMEAQARGESVAVTGDGVNDAPALRSANLGIAMQGGSEVAREAGHMILMDNNFSSVVKGMELGRTVFDNLKKVCIYLLPGGTFNEMLTVFVNVYFGIPAMLSNFQMLCISCLTDVAVSIALVNEKPETNIMYRPPRRANERLVNLKLLLYAYLVPGIITFVGCTNSYFWYSHEMGIPPGGQWLAFNGVTGTYPASNSQYPGQPIDVNSADPDAAAYAANYIAEVNYTGQSLYFVSTVICQWFNALAIRTRYESGMFQANPFYGPKRNLRLPIFMMLAFIFLLILTLVPWFNTVFFTREVPVKYACAAIGYGSCILIVDECRKWIVRNRPNSWVARVAW